ncbi:MAG: hypothetical protein P9M06_05020 [Candidatus Saelkia tenebricola]|nr:hypothetical protein [Candidatus Saelkia tenebricola]
MKTIRSVAYVVFIIIMTVSFSKDLEARRVQDVSSLEFILQELNQRIDSITVDFASGVINVYDAENGYFDVVESCYVLLYSELEYPEFIETLRTMDSAMQRYNKYVDFVETNNSKQAMLRSVVLDMSLFLQSSYGYAQGLIAGILQNTIPLLSNSLLGREVKVKLKNDLLPLLNSSDYAMRYHAVRCVGALAKGYLNPAIQSELAIEIAKLLSDSDMYVVGSAIKTLGDVLSSIEINDDLRDEMISELINLYVLPIYYPVNSYLEDSLRELIGNDPGKWREYFSDILGRHQILDRRSLLSYIFGDEQ